MKSRLSRILLSILILSLALQAFTLPAQAQSEADVSQAETKNLAVPQKIDQPSYPDGRDALHYPEDGFENMPPELEERYKRYAETVQHPDAIPPSLEIIAKTKAQVDSFDCSTVTDVPQIECEALVALYGSTNGAGWMYNSGWLQSTTVSTWHGVTVEMGRVTRVNLYYNQLTGSIPATLGNLSNLQSVNFGSNQLNGTIPAELGLLSNLEFLSLASNELTGGIPAELGSLSNLESLLLYNNQLTGRIPATLGNLANLHYLNLSFNQLTSISAELGNLSNLFELILSHNQLTSIPAELGNLSSLLALELYNNQLTSIPAELGNLANLKDLLLYNNQLTGRIPSSLGNLTNLETLYLFNNPLTGSIPLSFVNLTKMSAFYTYETSLCEPTTPEFLAWKNTVVDWQGTGVICTEDQDFFDCATVTDVPQIECEALVALYDSTNGSGWTNNTNWLQSTTVSNWHGVTVGSGVIYLNLFANQLNGSIPAALGNLSNLELLTLGFNQLTGSIPSSLGNLSNLEILNLQSNQLTGSIPANLGSLTNLDTLYLYNNQLTGSIPSSLGNLSNLDYLGLAFNQLTGSIPSSLGNLSNLRDMWLNDNPLTGSIPAEIGNLSNLESLGLYRNQLTGSIPAELGNLANLETLLLYNNQLTGGIPANLGNLSELYDLALQNNPLTGSIPLSFVNLTKLDYFQFYETSLCEPTTPEFLAWKNTVDEWYGTGIVCGENLPPVALDDSYITPFNTTLSVSAPGVLSNDTDADNDALTAIKLSDPGSGTLTFNADGSFTYAPVPGFGGTVSFTYKANDGELDSNLATVSIMVGTNTAPVAQGQEVTTAEDTAKEITLTATDVDGQSLTYSIVGQAS
ncbi:MAG: leucine-rich repeat domain-containing protein, partial [Anaerolineaceae bacterium]|nr:leucine-rich repeat domain-containing protein [Anaerolineaceae bacterium]